MQENYEISTVRRAFGTHGVVSEGASISGSITSIIARYSIAYTAQVVGN